MIGQVYINKEKKGNNSANHICLKVTQWGFIELNVVSHYEVYLCQYEYCYFIVYTCHRIFVTFNLKLY
jgi:hypothetical protein